MKKGILILFLLATPLLGIASHIVGGEFELIHITGFQYRLNMIIYFDSINGSAGALDDGTNGSLNGEDIAIFRKSDNVKMLTLHIPYISRTLVRYTQPSCSHGELVTLRELFSRLITLSPDNFNDPGGYYIAWERCCRNYSITNIFSDAPPGVNFAGQTFYLEFPPVVKDGVPFIDSTPRLFPPLNDFACPNRPYYTDFGGTDDDGDSLVYSIVTPLSTKTADAVPPPPVGTRSAPYDLVRWRPPFGLNNIMGGNPDLRISTDGFLTVKPSTQGLFVFAIKVEEFRNKVKIGETRRDFQMLVVDACPVAVPPVIMGKKLSDPTYTYNNVMSISYLNSVPDGDRCIQVQVSDDDSRSQDSNFIEQVSIKAIPLNFKKDLSGILPTIKNATLVNGSVAEFTICFPDCPYFVGGDPVIGIVAMDDACSLPLTDTLKITLHVEPPFNTKPYFTSTNPVNPPLGTVNEGTQTAWPFNVRDDDGDPLSISLLTNGFALVNEGMTFGISNQTNGAADGQLAWDARCDIYNFQTRTNFTVTILVEDQDRCLIPDPARAVYNLNVILPGNADPIIDTDLTSNSNERNVTGLIRRIYDGFNFNVTGKDLVDNDFLVMSGKGKDFNLTDYGITYAPNPVSANGQVGAGFQWTIACDKVDLKKKDTFDFQFIVVDNANKCRIYKADTVDVSLKILPPINQPPLLEVTNLNAAATTLSGGSISIIRGQKIDLMFTGLDSDVNPIKDKLKLEITREEGNVPAEGYAFTPVSGTSPLSAEFTWEPSCSIFQDGIYENEYDFTFMLSDDHCITARKDSVVLTVKVRDIDGSDEVFIPPNFFSPNGDNLNDYFAMEYKDPGTGEVINILPANNCASVFENVSIVNRWGKTVFESTDRNFRWNGIGEAPGVYFYTIKYSHKQYKGSVSLRY